MNCNHLPDSLTEIYIGINVVFILLITANNLIAEYSLAKIIIQIEIKHSNFLKKRYFLTSTVKKCNN